MRASRSLAALSGLAAVAFATVVVASPAAAATLPEGQRITVIVPSGPLVQPPFTTSWNVSPVDATGTQVGAAVFPGASGGVDVDDDGHGYALGYDQEQDRPFVQPYDGNTGTYGTPVVIQVGGFADSSCRGIDYLPSVALYVTCVNEDTETGEFVTMFGILDPVTGAYDVIVENMSGDEVPVILYESVATDPTTGTTWVIFSDETFQNFLAPVDFVNEELGTPIPVSAGVDVFGADFDRSGQLFASVQEDSVDPSANNLATINKVTGAVSQIGPYGFVTGPSFNIGSITVWGKPALAATGASGAEVAPIALGSALLLLAGAAFVATGRLQRRTV